MSTLPTLPDEVLRAVCHYLMEDRTYLNPAGYRGFESLLVLARTSRVFHEHALDAIWRILPDFGLLVFTMPQDAWTMKEDSGQSLMNKPLIFVSLTRQVMLSDLARFDNYARRVKCIMDRYDCFHLPIHARRYVFETSLLSSLAPYFSDQPLFPNLEVLHASPRWHRASSYNHSFPLLFTPRLREFHTNLASSTRASKHSGYDDYVQILTRLQEIAPTLTALTLSVDVYPLRPPYGIIAAICTALCSFQHLVAIHVVDIPLNMQLIAHLSQLRQLNDMDFLLSDDITVEDLGALQRNTICFPVLLTLRITHRCSLPQVTCFVGQVRSPHLEAISIVMPNAAVHLSLDDYTGLFDMLSKCDGRLSLRELRVSTCPDNRAEFVISDRVLEPLLELKNITRIVLDLHVGFALSDTAIASMAIAWPDLSVLDLGPGSIDDPISVTEADVYDTVSQAERPSLMALFYFAQACPHLCHLGLVLDTDVKRLTSVHRRVRPGLGKVQGSLTSLNVGRSTITDPLAVASFLSDLFPNLEDIECGWELGDEDEYDEDEDAEQEMTEEMRERIRTGVEFRRRWAKVEWKLLPQFVKIRKQEREWARLKGLKVLPAIDFTQL